jgi:hypothetical protein
MKRVTYTPDRTRSSLQFVQRKSNRWGEYSLLAKAMSRKRKYRHKQYLLARVQAR